MTYRVFGWRVSLLHPSIRYYSLRTEILGNVTTPAVCMTEESYVSQRNTRLIRIDFEFAGWLLWHSRSHFTRSAALVLLQILDRATTA